MNNIVYVVQTAVKTPVKIQLYHKFVKECVRPVVYAKKDFYVIVMENVLIKMIVEKLVSFKNQQKKTDYLTKNHFKPLSTLWH